MEPALTKESRYDYTIDLATENSSHTKILRLVGRDNYVLEIGCATGYMTRYLEEELGCKVFCIEIDPKSANKASPYCEELLVEDIEQLDFDEAFKKKRFDVVIMADVLEHMKNPRSVLGKLRRFLNEAGYIILSIPNGAHGSMGLELLDGKWEYRSEGLLDSTHLRFFDKDSLTALLDEAGYLISRMDRVIVHPRDTEMKTPWDSYPRDVTAYLEKVNPEYKTYQFVVKIYPTSPIGWKKGLEDAVESEKEKKRISDERLKKVEKELNSLRGEVAGFEAERRKTAEEYLDNLRKEMSRIDKEFSEDRRGYEDKISQLEREMSGIHRGYQNKISQLEKEMRGMHSGYGDKISQLEEEISGSHSAYQDEIQRLKMWVSETCHGFQTELAYRDEQINGLQLEVHHFRNENLLSCEELSRLRQEKANVEALAATFARESDEMRNSLTWRLITRYRRMIDRWLPFETRRRRLYRLCLLAPVVLSREGPAAFFRRISARIPGLGKSERSGSLQLPTGNEYIPLSFPHFDKIYVTIIIPVYSQCDHTYRCLESILENTSVPYEIIVVDNASDSNTVRMLDTVQGVQVIHNEKNEGFSAACNQGAEASNGQTLLFLNNDTQVTKGWLEAMLTALEGDDVGIVGAKLIYPNGRLQEAGNIVWQEGTGWNYGRGDDPDLPQYSYLREVDYCSGACIMIRKDFWVELGGFDHRYSPAYYEDTDLCFAARRRGYKIIYQPEARIVHYEGASAGTDIDEGYKIYQKENLSKFKEKWGEVLGAEHYAGPEDLYVARERGFSKRALVVDHYVPTFDMDSGSLRMFSLLKIFKELGYKVIFWPENKAFHERYTRELQRLGVEVLYGDIDFVQYLKDYGHYMDLILLSRPHIAVDFIYAAKTLSKARIIYDTVDLSFVREGRRVRVEAEEVIEYWKGIELFLSSQADDTLVVSPVEKEILEKEGFQGKVSVVSNVHSLEPCSSPFEQREGLMFIGGFLHLPNEDGIAWFVEQILPIIRHTIPEVNLYIVGSHPTDKVKSMASPDVFVTGYVEDVGPYFERARIFVCPLRYGAGVKGKVGQSMSYGLPIVTTTIGAEGMGLTDGHDALIADDERIFAEKVIKAYQDRRLWEGLSLNARALVEQTYSPDAVKGALQSILGGGEIV